MNRETLDEFLRLDDLVKQTEIDIAWFKDQRKEAEEALKKEFENDGINSVRATDGRLVFLHRQLWARAIDGNRDAVVEALSECGMAEFITTTYNANTISSYVREQAKLGEELPAPLRATLQVDEVFSLRARKS